MINLRDELERIPSAAALSAKDRSALVKALESLVKRHSQKLESPALKKRIAALTKIQGQIKDLETKFYEERAALKARQKRFQEKGYNFRLYTLTNNEVLAKEITDQDEEALQNLEDIKCSKISNSKGFKMEFIFNDNPYFENSVLIKTYQMTNDNKPILEKASGTKIKWFTGKILTKNCPSFFNFFKPRQAADVQSRMHRDYDIFSTIRDEIIPQWHQMNMEKTSNSYIYGEDEELLKTMLFRERAVLEGKYQKLYEPLYKKRYELVNGTTDVQKTKKRTAVDQEGDKAREEKGVPYFWATAMKNEEVVAQKITKCDEEALKYLKDIKWCRIKKLKGFKLEFFFDQNPFFKNTVLTKAYHMSSDGPSMLEKTIGTNINWHPGKSLTASLLKRPRKRSKNAEFLTKQRSFFNFFNATEYPELPDDYSTYMHHDNFRKIEDQFEVQRDIDYEVGKTIRDKIIPHAVSLFTGEAVEMGTDYEDVDDDDDLYDDYYSDDEEEEEAADDEDNYNDDDEEEKNDDEDDDDEDHVDEFEFGF